ncbi:hypothetical protein GCM10009765_12890 [Fodinicola feengrottensis]|uniref:CBM-cenC domain-containing protein n=1 Tax=Fodinicola feengrottensis TaxID=435914 RepID=A0ABP4S2H3_9ACTN
MFSSPVRLAGAALLAFAALAAGPSPASAATGTSTEGETLVAGATLFQATAQVQSGATWSGDKQLLMKVTSGQTQGMVSNTVALPSDQAASYHVTALLTTGPNYGVVELQFGGHGGNYFDAYSAKVAVKTVEFTNVVIFPSGSATTLSLYVGSKNAASSGYSAGLDKVTLDLTS